MGFNAYIDPYNCFGRHDGGVAGADGSNNLVLKAMIEVGKLPAEAKQNAQIVIVGDSRAHGLTESRVSSIDGHPVLNLGIGGASFEEMLSFLADQAPQLKSARLLVVCAPLERFAAAPRANRVLEVKPIVANPLRYLANAEMLKNSWEIWRKPAVAHVKTSRDERGAEERERDDKDVRSTWRRMYGDFDHDRANLRIKALREAIQPFTARGAAAVFWSPPIRENIASILDKLDLQKERLRLSRELTNFGTAVDMTDWDSITGQKFTFKDPVHANEGALILKELEVVFPR